ncbi:MAG: DUF2807 domain-containing protein [Sandaracinaceae bacterium]
MNAARACVIVIVIALGASACTAVEGSGTPGAAPLRVVDREDGPLDALPEIRGLAVEGPFHVEATIADAVPTAVVEGDDNLLSRIEGQIDEHGYLTIRPREAIFPTLPLVVRIEARALEFVTAREEGSSARVSGIVADRFGLSASVGADVTADGTCATLTLVASGDAHADASALTCTDASIDAQGSARVEARVTGTLSVTASGESAVVVSGEPNRVDRSLSDRATLELE